MTTTLSTPSARYGVALAASIATTLFLLLGIGALGIVRDAGHAASCCLSDLGKVARWDEAQVSAAPLDLHARPDW